MKTDSSIAGATVRTYLPEIGETMRPTRVGKDLKEKHALGKWIL